MGSTFSYTVGLRSWYVFLVVFLEFQNKSREQLWTTASELFDIFSLNFSVVHFSGLEAFNGHLFFVKNFINFKMLR